jgi:NAD-dependent SIR2 family protein deacetylase
VYKRKKTNVWKYSQRMIWKPTLTHMALCELVKRDIIKCVITQNCDNLHQMSGIDGSKVVVLGNILLIGCSWWSCMETVLEKNVNYVKRNIREIL